MSNIITITEAKDALHIATTNTEFDSILTYLVAAADDMINNYCAQNILSATASYVFSGNGDYKKLLPNFPVTAITELVTRENMITAYGAAISSSLYSLESLNGGYYVVYSPYFNQAEYNYKITYTYGYSASTVPEIIKVVAREIVASLFKNMDQKIEGRLGVQNISDNINGMINKTYTFKNEEPRWKAILQPYTRGSYA